MNKDPSLRLLQKKLLSGQAIVASLLAIHGLFLIIIGLIAFFNGFAGVYDVVNGHVTPRAAVAVLGAVLAWILLLGGIVSFLCVQGLLARQRWAFWLTMTLESINLIVGGSTIGLHLFTPWPIALSMSGAGGILLYMFLVIGTRIFSHWSKSL